MSRRITAALSAAALTLVLATGGASGGSSPGQQPPKNLTPPSVSGAAQVPNTLSSSPGKWQGKGLKFAYQWLRCDSTGASCGSISGATAKTKTLTAADVAHTLRVIVTATNRNGSAAATSSQTAVVATAASATPPPPPPPPPTTTLPPSNTALPDTSGTAQQGQPLNASTGSWSGSTPMTYGYQWQRCDSSGGACAAISGATGASYVLATADVGRRMRVSITASNSVGSATASSDATAVVASSSSTNNLSTCGGYWAPTGTPVCASGAKLVRTFESPETIPPDNACCGPWWKMQISVPDNSSAVVAPDPAGGSNRVMKLTVAPGSGSYDQAAMIHDRRDSLAQIGLDSWYSWDQYLDPSWTGAPNTQWNWTQQFLNDPDDPNKCPGQHNANLAIGVYTTSTPKWVFEVEHAGVQTLSNCDVTGTNYFYGPPVVKGRWQHWVEHVYWSAHSDGHWQIWLDGVLVLDHYGPNIYEHPNGTSGLDESYWFDYRSGSATGTDVVYFDNVAIGPTASSIGATG